jgi:hypothetical protein
MYRFRDRRSAIKNAIAPLYFNEGFRVHAAYR